MGDLLLTDRRYQLQKVSTRAHATAAGAQHVWM